MASPHRSLRVGELWAMRGGGLIELCGVAPIYTGIAQGGKLEWRFLGVHGRVGVNDHAPGPTGPRDDVRESREMHMRQRLYAICVVVILARAVRACAAPPEIEGDRTLFEAVHAAQVANSAKLSEGQYRAQLHIERPNETLDTTAMLAWRNDATHISYSTLSESRGKSRQDHGEIIKKGNATLFWIQSQRLLQRVWFDEIPISRDLRLRPDQRWFHSTGLNAWDHYFNLSKLESPPLKLASAGAVVQPNEDEISVTWHLPYDVVLTLVCSLQADGNVVRYESPSEGRSGSYEWDRTADGVSYLKRARHEKVYPASKGYGEKPFVETLEVSEFSPRCLAPPSRFEEASWQLPRGTVVEERRNGQVRRWQLGERPAVVEEEFEALAEGMRQAGFGKRRTP